MKHYTNAALTRAPWCAADGKVGPWLCAQGCRMEWGGAAHRGIRGYGPCQWLHPAMPAALGGTDSAQGRNGPCFQQGKWWHEVCKPMVEHGDKNLPACCLQKGMVRQTQLIKVAHLLLCFPFRVQIIGAVWKAKALLLQTKHSPALQPLQANCTHSGGEAQLWGQGSCLWSVCQKCCLHDWLGGSWEPQLPVPSPLGSCKPRHVFTRVRANS